jgi:hypothetical protein
MEVHGDPGQAHNDRIEPRGRTVEGVAVVSWPTDQVVRPGPGPLGRTECNPSALKTKSTEWWTSDSGGLWKCVGQREVGGSAGDVDQGSAQGALQCLVFRAEDCAVRPHYPCGKGKNWELNVSMVV